MSYDPSRRMPPRQERWPSATPARGWPSYRDADAYRGGEDAYRGGEQADHGYGYGYEADRPAAYPATGYRASHRRAAGEPDGRGYSSLVAADAFGPAGNGYGYQTGGYQTRGYRGDGYAADDFDGTVNGYSGDGYGYAAPADGYAGAANGFGSAANGYSQAGNGYGHADGFAAGPNDLGPGSYTEYNEHLSGDPTLTAPDAGVQPGSWQAEQDSRREARQRGMLVGGVTELLGTAVAIGVSTLVAGLIKAQTSPAAAMGSVFADRTPAALVRHFGAHGQAVLLLGMYAAIAFVALVIGVMARRATALGVAGIAAFTLVTAFAVITRPASHVGDLTPAVIGGMAGVAALLWLVRASAPAQPAAPLRHAHGGARRRSR